MSEKKDTAILSNALLVTLAVSIQLYIVTAYDLVAEYEILFDLPLYFTVAGIFPLIVILILTFLKNKRRPSKSSMFILLCIATLYLTLVGERNGLFLGRKMLHGEFLDDRSRMEIKLYESGNFILFSDWMLGLDRYEGNYAMKGDTILIKSGLDHFRGIPGKAMLWDRTENKLYFRQGGDQTFSKDFYYFTLD